jgi:hypothetical protein
LGLKGNIQEHSNLHKHAKDSRFDW